MKPVIHFLSVLLLFLSPAYCRAQGRDSAFIFNLDDPSYSKEGECIQRFNYQLNQGGDHKYTIALDGFRCNSAQDSVHIYELYFEHMYLRKGTHSIVLNYKHANENSHKDPRHFEILERFRLVPPGRYRIRVTLIPEKDTVAETFSGLLEYSIDSNLAAGSKLRQQINKGFQLPGAAVPKQLKPGLMKASAEQAKLSNARMQRKLKHIKGLQTKTESAGDKTWNLLYFEDIYLGRYPLATAQAQDHQARFETQALDQDPTQLISNDLDGFRSISSQLRQLHSNKAQDKEMSGTVDVNTYTSTSRDPAAVTDPSYSEFYGEVNVDVMGVPVSLEGFYTTQDRNRSAKASYFRVHYDVETAKNRLQKAIDGYKSKFGETMAKGQGLAQVYGNYSNQLQGQYQQQLGDLARTYKLDPAALAQNKGNLEAYLKEQLPDTSGLQQQLTDKAQDALQSDEDSSGSDKKSLADRKAQLERQKAKAEEKRKDIQERVQKLAALQEKINKYVQLLERYRTQTQLDSSLYLKQLNELKSKDPSCKDLAKAADGLLPDGKAKQFVTGLTSFDAGIINKYQSDYTMAGQNLKGLSLGYDLGVITTGIAVGNTEYVNREGTTDKYTTYMVRADMKERGGQKVGFIYNGLAPSQALMKDNQFIGNANIALPGFRSPTHILSLVYDGQISKSFVAHMEAAQSIKAGQGATPDLGHAAIKSNISYDIPRSSISFKGEWEHLGTDFENNALPYTRSGTERYTASTGFDLFRSFLSVKVDYNYLLQQNFSGEGKSTKWGFDVRTHTKRYPNVQLSYKPFSTFRSFNDTFNTPQRPLFGSVWAGRLSYQFKRNKITHRFSVTYSRNSSINDTERYNSSTLQAIYQYNKGNTQLQATAGQIIVPGDYNSGTGIVTSYTLGCSASMVLNSNFSITAGPDIGVCTWGFQRISGTGGVVYKLTQKPLSFRMSLRYSNYRNTEADPRQQLWAGQAGLNWQFKRKSK